MTTVTVLVSKDDLTDMFGDFWTYSNLNDYVAYKVKPYLNLHVFSYYEFEGLPLPIDGKAAPTCLQRELNRLYQKQLSQIKLQKTDLLDIRTLGELCENSEGIKLLKMLAGNLTEKSIFYNAITQSAYIDSATIELINISPDKYVLTQINLHK